MNNSIKFIIGVIESLDEDDVQECSDRCREEWYYEEQERENRMLCYLHRWWVKKYNLPIVIRAEIVKWLRGDPILSKYMEPLAVAVEKNKRELLIQEEIEI